MDGTVYTDKRKTKICELAMAHPLSEYLFTVLTT